MLSELRRHSVRAVSGLLQLSQALNRHPGRPGAINALEIVRGGTTALAVALVAVRGPTLSVVWPGVVHPDDLLVIVLATPRNSSVWQRSSRRRDKSVTSSRRCRATWS